MAWAREIMAFYGVLTTVAMVATGIGAVVGTGILDASFSKFEGESRCPVRQVQSRNLEEVSGTKRISVESVSYKCDGVTQRRPFTETTGFWQKLNPNDYLICDRYTSFVFRQTFWKDCRPEEKGVSYE